MYSEPRYSSVWPFWRPKPLTSVTVIPTTPSSCSASLTSSSLNGLITASIFFIRASGYWALLALSALPYSVAYSRAEASQEKSSAIAFLTSAFQSAGCR